VRVRFAKLGKVRFTSHRDVARMWERAFRKAGVPVAYTAGFTPRPRISFGLALPTGHESLAEYLDVDVDERVADALDDATAFLERVSDALPGGVDATAAAAVGAGTPSLQEDVTSCSWRVEPRRGGPSLADLLTAGLAAPALPVQRSRKGKDVIDDVRPAVLDAGLEAPGVLVCELATQPRGVRPTELLAAIGADPAGARVCRTHQWIERDGARREPLSALRAPHAELRAS
jgi:radical SAM-linked protein